MKLLCSILIAILVTLVTGGLVAAQDKAFVHVPADVTTYESNHLGATVNGDRFYGLMDELKIYNRALSHAKITGCYMCRD